MAEKRFFLRLAGAALLGVVALAIAGILFLFFLPWLLLAAVGVFILLAIFLVMWVTVYAVMFVGVAIYYIFKPMRVSKKKGKYGLKRIKEAGKRQKGKTRKRK